MPSIFSKNCVVSGVLDAYCLVCSQHLRDHEEALPHIQDTQHRRNLDSIAYFDKFKKDYIKKVKGIYFCEVCNMTFATATKVGLHVTEEAHLGNKRYKSIKRVANTIIVQDSTAITEDAWNGIVEDTCVLCNEDIDGDSSHKTEKKHVLNLIKCTVTVDTNNYVYREINDMCQCLTCNKVVSGNVITEHLNSEEHKSSLPILDRVGTEINKMKIVEDNDGAGDGKDSSTNDDNNTCVEKDKTVKDVPPTNSVDGKTLFTKPVQMKDKQQPNSTKSVPEDVQTFAKQHGLSVKDGGRVYCDVCRSQVTPTLERVKQHVTESKHKDNMTVHNQINKKISKNINKLLLEEFITQFQMFENNGALFVVINDKFCVHGSDFIGIVRTVDRVICHFCLENVYPSMLNFIIHMDTPRHTTVMKEISVITSLENEFVRQIKPNLYDCCFCGLVERDWDVMRAHLNSAEHKWQREQHDRLLQRYREHVIEEQFRQTMPFNWIALLSRMQQQQRPF